MAEIADKAMCLAESLRSARRLAPAKHLESSSQMLVIPLDFLLLCFSSDVLDFREYGGQRGQVGGGLVGGDRVRRVTPVLARAERKNALAAFVSRCSRNSPSMTCPYSSIAR